MQGQTVFFHLDEWNPHHFNRLEVESK